MKYIIRAIKYFFYFSFFIFVVMLLLVAFGVVEGNIETMFRNGWDSIWQIAVMFACVAAFYPLFGFAKKEFIVPVDAKDPEGAMVEFMKGKGYEVETHEGDNYTFRARKAIQRVCKIWEDRLTFTKTEYGYEVEGLRKDVFRIAYGIEYILRNQSEQ